MKKQISLLLVASMCVSLLVGCGSSTSTQVKETDAASQQAATTEAAELPVLRVAYMSMFNGTEINYIIKNGLDIKNGFKIEPIQFTSGAPINEALSTDSFDVAATGGAYLFGITNFDAKVIGIYADESAGSEVWVKSDSDIAKVKGYNKDYPTVLGDPDTVKGCTILQTTGTTQQYMAVTWLKSLGLGSDDVEMVNMDPPTVYQAFASGRGDAAALAAPYCYKADPKTMTMACQLTDFGKGVYAYLMMPSSKYKDADKKELSLKLLKVMWQVGSIFKDDHNAMIEAVNSYYEECGNATTKDDVIAQCEGSFFFTAEDLKDMEFGKMELEYANFMVDEKKLEADKIDIMKGNIDVAAFETTLKEALTK